MEILRQQSAPECASATMAAGIAIHETVYLQYSKSSKMLNGLGSAWAL